MPFKANIFSLSDKARNSLKSTLLILNGVLSPDLLSSSWSKAKDRGQSCRLETKSQNFSITDVDIPVNMCDITLSLSAILTSTIDGN